MSYRLKDGDIVEFVEPVKIPGCAYCPDFIPNGVWHAACVLPKVRGVVVHARTPKVLRAKGTPPYFANVDVPMPDGRMHRVRPEWHQIRRLRAGTPL